MYISSSVYNVNVRFSFVINYVSEYRLPHAIDTFHTTPTIHVNQDPMLLKLIGRHCLCLSGFRTYPGPRSWLLTLNQTLPRGSQVTCITGQVTYTTCINRNRNRTKCQSPHENPTVEPSFSCTTYILGSPKIHALSPPSILQSQNKLFNIRLSRFSNAHVT